MGELTARGLQQRRVIREWRSKHEAEVVTRMARAAIDAQQLAQREIDKAIFWRIIFAPRRLFMNNIMPVISKHFERESQYLMTEATNELSVITGIDFDHRPLNVKVTSDDSLNLNLGKAIAVAAFAVPPAAAFIGYSLVFQSAIAYSTVLFLFTTAAISLPIVLAGATLIAAGPILGFSIFRWVKRRATRRLLLAVDRYINNSIIEQHHSREKKETLEARIRLALLESARNVEDKVCNGR